MRRRNVVPAAAGIAIIASLAPLAPLPPPASANVFDVFWVPVAGDTGGTPYPAEATSGPGGDPQLLTMQTWDLSIYNNEGGDWSSAGMRLVLPAGNVFYQHSFGTNTKPSSLLTSVFPALAFDTYVTSPSDTGTSGAPAVTGGYPTG